MSRIATEYCECSEDCLVLGTSAVVLKNSKCKQIMSKSSYTYNDIIGDFAKLGLTNSSFGKLKNGKKFTWENVRKIKSELHKKVFWAFRKGIVDSVISSLLTGSSVTAHSVGSVKISSDYDITLFGDSRRIGWIIKQFDVIIKDLFLKDAATLFDTNLYARGFIQFTPLELSSVCNNEIFYYSPFTDADIQSQFVWALLHCFRSLVTVYSRESVDMLWDEIRNKDNKAYIDGVAGIYDLLENQDLAYIDIINLDNPFEMITANLHNSHESLEGSSNRGGGAFSNFDVISLTNYYASEAYYSYGAFMDVVVNQQMCKQPKQTTLNTETIPMNIHTITQSILDNLAFFMVHPVEKYKNRIRRTRFYQDVDFTLVTPSGATFAEYTESVSTTRAAVIEMITNIVNEYCKQFESVDSSILSLVNWI